MSGPTKPKRGRILGRYNPIQSIAHGGMGEILLARTEGAEGFSRPVVIKRIRSGLASADMEQMFVREARLLSYLSHPGIVSVVDFGKDDRDFVMVLEYVHGYDLGIWARYQRQRERPFDPQLAIHVMIEVLAALEHVHHLRRPDGSEMCLVHRDISPANVLIDTEGHVKLTDFGIAKAAETSNMFTTEANLVKGKLPYLAPELFDGLEPSPQSDIYACGVMLHELLAGVNEFYVRGQPSATIELARTHRVTKLSELRDDCPPGLDLVIEQALAKDPRGRYPDAGLFAQDLLDVLGSAPSSMHRALRDAVQYDFLGLLPDVLEISSLDDRARSLANAPRMTSAPPRIPTGVGVTGEDEIPTDVGILSASTEPEPSTDEQPTDVVGASEGMPTTKADLSIEEQPQPRARSADTERETNSGARTRRSRSSITRMLPAIVAVLALGVALVSLFSSKGGDENIYVVEERPLAIPRAPPESEPDVERPGLIDPRALTQRIVDQQEDVRRCLELEAATAAATGELSLRFSIDGEGEVQQLELAPAGLESTEMGRCLLDLGRATRFPASGSALVFEIPLRTRLHPAPR